MRCRRGRPTGCGPPLPTDPYLPAGCLAQTRTYVYITHIALWVESNRHHTTADSDTRPTGGEGGGGSGGGGNAPPTSHQRRLNGITRPGARVGVAASPPSVSSASSRPYSGAAKSPRSSRFSAPIFVVCRLAPPAFLWLERKSVTNGYLWLKSRWRSEKHGHPCLPAARAVISY